MHNVLIWPRAIDRKIAVAILALAFASCIGALLPTPDPGDGFTLINAFLCGALLFVVWSGFRLVRPVNYSAVWREAELIAVPVIWGLLVLVFAIWFAHQQIELDDGFRTVMEPLKHLNKL